MINLENTSISLAARVKLMRIYNLMYNIVNSNGYANLIRGTANKNNIAICNVYNDHHHKCASIYNILGLMNRMSKAKPKWSRGLTQALLIKLNMLWVILREDFKDPEFDYLFGPHGRDV